jgi:Spy/CpxP family protein refolding chaperone
LVWLGLAAVLTGQMAGAGVVAVSAAVEVPAVQSPPNTGGASGGPSNWEWWNDAGVQKELGLTADKIKSINDFYSRRNEDLRPFVQEFLKQREELGKMTQARVVDESTYLLQVMRVESARARLNESRTVMLYRMYKSLSPEQHQKLQDIMDRRFNRDGRGGRQSPGVR